MTRCLANHYESLNFSRVTSGSMTHDLDDPINEDLINFVIIYQSAVRFLIYTPSDDSLMIRESSNHEMNRDQMIR